jgi:hypothetical protein
MGEVNCLARLEILWRTNQPITGSLKNRSNGRADDSANVPFMRKSGKIQAAVRVGPDVSAMA